MPGPQVEQVRPDARRARRPHRRHDLRELLGPVPEPPDHQRHADAGVGPTLQPQPPEPPQALARGCGARPSRPPVLRRPASAPGRGRFLRPSRRRPQARRRRGRQRAASDDRESRAAQPTPGCTVTSAGRPLPGWSGSSPRRSPPSRRPGPPLQLAREHLRHVHPYPDRRAIALVRGPVCPSLERADVAERAAWTQPVYG